MKSIRHWCQEMQPQDRGRLAPVSLPLADLYAIKGRTAEPICCRRPALRPSRETLVLVREPQHLPSGQLVVQCELIFSSPGHAPTVKAFIALAVTFCLLAVGAIVAASTRHLEGWYLYFVVAAVVVGLAIVIAIVLAP
jgi:hypothetical protein